MVRHILSSWRAVLMCWFAAALAQWSPLVIAAAPGGFKVFDSIGGMPGKPDLAAYGFDTNLILLSNGVTPNPLIFNSDWTVNTGSLQNYVGSLPTNTVITLDFEGGPWHYHKSVNQECQSSADRLDKTKTHRGHQHNSRYARTLRRQGRGLRVEHRPFGPDPVPPQSVEPDIHCQLYRLAKR